MLFYDVIIPRPLDKLFTYKCSNSLEVGTRVLVPVKDRPVPAIIYRIVEPPEYECKEIVKSIDAGAPFFDKKYLNLIENIKKAYYCSLGEILEALFNKKLLKSDFTLISNKITHNVACNNNSVYKSQVSANKFNSFKELFESDKLINLFENNNIEERLEIYSNIIIHYLTRSKQIKIICPDQKNCNYVMQFLSQKIGIKMEPYSSVLGMGMKKKIVSFYREGKMSILIGTRSVLGIPGKEEGLIIIESEEDEFYKQEESPYLQFRDIGIIYAKTYNIPLILGTSMPSLESLYRVENGELNHILLDIEKSKKVKLHIVDMKNDDVIANVINSKLYDVLYNNIKKNYKTVILANKKGFSKHLICSSCGFKLMCCRCSIQATYYKSKNYCKCSYCGSSIELICRNCGSHDFFEIPTGLEHVEEVLNSLFNKKIIKIDREELVESKDDNDIYKRIDEGDFDILLGTFIVLRRFCNLNVKTGLLLGIEDLLSLPDFRIYEKTMRLLFKFVGFIDNFSNANEFYIQSYDKNLVLFRFLEEGKKAFYHYEMRRRKIYNYSPFIRLARVVLSSRKKEGLGEKIHIIAEEAKKIEGIEIIGPTAPPIFFLRNQYRYNFLIKSSDNLALETCYNVIKESFLRVKKGSMKCKIDIDPYFFI